MPRPDLAAPEIDWLLDAALREDRADDDVTTRALVSPDLRGDAGVVARRPGVLCGLPVCARLVSRFCTDLEFAARLEDGSAVQADRVVASLRGPVAAILTVERTLLNFLQRLSGIATLTARFVREVQGTAARIYDTRKTSPGWRRLEKYAVSCGGGRNHRMDLSEQVLVKGNHLRALQAAGTAGANGPTARIATAVSRARESSPAGMTVEVEAESMDEVRAAVEAQADIILLDNMTPGQVSEAVALTRGLADEADRPLLEASGGITLDNVRKYAETGVDRISVGALTHSAPALDVSLDLCV